MSARRLACACESARRSGGSESSLMWLGVAGTLNMGQHERPTFAGRLDGDRGSPSDVDDVDNSLT
jgi:hypothetical protein